MAKKHLTARFDETVLNRFTKASEAFSSADAYMTHLLDTAEKAEASSPLATVADILALLECPHEESALIERALKSSLVPWKVMFRTALVREAKSQLTSAERMKDLDLSDPKARHLVQGAGFARCREILDGLIATNNAARTLEGKRYITRKLIMDEAGVSINMAIHFCKVCADEIAAHNKAMGFGNPEEGRRHNQWVYKAPASLAEEKM
jgi:hypothetical protein